MGTERRHRSEPLRRAIFAAGVATLALTLIAVASGAMRSAKVGPRLCETTGGGRFVKIPGHKGERIDRRLLADIRFLKRRWPIFITDGYSIDPVHSANGEHPIGLALDIVPNKADGGRWRDIRDLAMWAEPKQDRPRAPFRWVGYDGDSGHGHRHHLHLSWSHSPTSYNKPARVVWTIRCPQPPPDKPADGGGWNGGVSPGESEPEESTGGVPAKRLDRIHPEADGISSR